MTGLAARLAGPPSWLRLPRPTARLRLTLLYGCVFTLSGAALLGFTYWLFDRATAGKRILPVDGPRSNITCLPRHHGCRPFVQIFMHQHALDLRTLLAQSGIALAVTVALAFALGWLIAGRVLRPVRVITSTARRISANSLHERFALAKPDDEFNELARTLNDLFGRLDASFTAQRRFVANASHELRTPLTLDRTLLQVALRNPRTTAEQWHATARELLESGQHQERLLEALLTLATSEAGISNREPADLSEAVAASLRAASHQIGAQQLRVETSLSPAPVIGDPDLIRRLTDNLLDNAVNHNRFGGTVSVTTGRQNGYATFSITNTGPVILPAEIERLFRPFERLAAIRTGESKGHGLGLSIVTAIVSAHSAEVMTHARPEGGLRIEVTFPACN